MKNIGNIILNLLSLVIAICGGLMSMDASVHALGLFSPQVSLWWPVVLAASTVVNRVALLIKGIWGDLMDDGVINNSYPKSLPIILIACAMLSLSGCATRSARTSDPKAVKPVSAPFNFSFGVVYNGVSAGYSRTDGRNNFGVNVDAKQVVRAVRR